MSAEKGVDAAFLRYYQELPTEAILLSATTIDFTSDKIKMGVQDAFYGLQVFTCQPRFLHSCLSLVSQALAPLVHKVA